MTSSGLLKLKIAVVESSYRTRNHYLVVSLVKALRRHVDVSSVTLLDLPQALPKTSKAHFDVIIVFGGEQADNIIIAELRRRCSVSVIWYLEDPYERVRNIATCGDFDIVLTNDRNSAIYYGSSAHHLPLAAEKLFTRNNRRYRERRYDLSFVGTLWPNRARFLAEARDALSSLRCKIEVTDNEYIRSALAEISFPYRIGSGVDFLDFMKISEESRLGLMIDRDFSGSTDYSVSDTPGPRFFELGSVGVCLLVDTRVCGDLALFGFVDGEDYLGFEDVTTFRRLIAQFRTQPDRFEAIGRSLQAKIAAAHTYDHRASAILELVRSKLNYRSKKQLLQTASRRFPRILAITHNLTLFGSSGGAEIYLEHLVRSTQKFQWSLISRNGSAPYGTRYAVLDGALDVKAELKLIEPFSDVMLRHYELERYFLDTCLSISPDVIVINHLHGFPPSIPLIAQSLGIPYVFVLHDYYVACDEFNLLMPEQVFCNVTHPDSDLCNICTFKRRALHRGSQARRRAVYGKVLASAEVIVTNSASVSERTARLVGIEPTRFEIIQPPLIDSASRQCERNTDGFLRNVALLGNLQPNKGVYDFIEIADSLKDLGIRFHVFGANHPVLTSKVAEGALPNVVLHGRFQPGEFPRELYQCDVALFLSRWPETYCMSLTEALNIGLVPIVYKLGALAERVTDEIGFKVDPRPEQVSSLIRKLVTNPQALHLRAFKLRAMPHRPDPFIDRYTALFESISSNSTNRLSDVRRAIFPELGLEWVPNTWSTEAISPPVPSVTHAKKRLGSALFRSATEHLRRNGTRKTIARVVEWMRI